MILFIWFRCKGCFKDFPVIEYTYVVCFKVSLWFVLALCGLIIFMVYWATVYSEPFQTSKMEFFVKIVTSNAITSLLRRWKGFWIHLCWMQSKLLGHALLYIYIYIYIAVYFMFEITCIFCHFSTIRFSSETLGI